MITFKEYVELFEEKQLMSINRFAVVDANNQPRFIGDDEKEARKLAKRMSGHDVRKIFAPRKPKDSVIPIVKAKQ